MNALEVNGALSVCTLHIMPSVCVRVAMGWEALCRREGECASLQSESVRVNTVNMTHSVNCRDPTTFWDRNTATCAPCPIKPGYEPTINCGYDDNGGRHELPNRKCSTNTFNDGSGALCRACTSCPRGQTAVKPCSSISDTQCSDDQRDTALGVSVPPRQGPSLVPPAVSADPVPVLWAVPLAALFSILLVLLSAWFIYVKKNRGQRPVLSYSRNSSMAVRGFSPLSAPAENSDLEDVLSPDILSAPLQTVLDKLDVLEELVMLLDPDSQVVKNTKHLASLCSFSSAWITYTYSMKDIKSPLKAVLEGVTSRHPDWTVGHLAKLLKQIERNDAIAILTRLRLNELAV